MYAFAPQLSLSLNYKNVYADNPRILLKAPFRLAHKSWRTVGPFSLVPGSALAVLQVEAYLLKCTALPDFFSGKFSLTDTEDRRG